MLSDEHHRIEPGSVLYLMHGMRVVPQSGTGYVKNIRISAVYVLSLKMVQAM